MKAKLLDLKIKKNLWNDLFWVFKSAFHGNGLEFAEHREYVFWDSVKHIDWKLSSKTQKLFIKKYDEEKTIKITFIVDLNESFYQFKNKLELLEEIFYTLAISWLKNNDNISIYINWFWLLPYSNSFQSIIRWINIIEKWVNKYENLENIIEKIALNPKIKNNLIFILSDNDTINNERNWKLLWYKNEVIYINIFDYFENKLEKLDSSLNVNYDKNYLSINLSDKKRINEYKLLREKKLELLKYNLLKSNINYLYLDTQLNSYKELYKFFLEYNALQK